MEPHPKIGKVTKSCPCGREGLATAGPENSPWNELVYGQTTIGIDRIAFSNRGYTAKTPVLKITPLVL